jgi:molybdopterin converting factor small subunit
MKVKVYPGPFCRTDALDDDGFMEVEEGAVVGDVIKKLKYSLPIRALGLYMVNYKKAGLDTRLKEGDVISIITPLAGG